MNKGIKEEVDKVTLNLLMARNMENSYYNNCLDLQKLNNLYSFQNNSLYGNLNAFQTIQSGNNPSFVMANIQNLGNLNNLLTFSNTNNNNQTANLTNFATYANYSNVAKMNNGLNNYENSPANASNCVPLNNMKSNEEKAFNFLGQQTVICFLCFFLIFFA